MVGLDDSNRRSQSRDKLLQAPAGTIQPRHIASELALCARLGGYTAAGLEQEWLPGGVRAGSERWGLAPANDGIQYRRHMRRAGLQSPDLL
jgi:hypothetical protein